MRIFLPAILILCQSGPTLAELPPPFAARYQLHSEGLQLGVMERQFDTGDTAHLSLESNSRTTGLVALFRDDTLMESSRWQQSQAGPRLLRYEYLRTSKDKQKHRLIEIDRDRGTISNLAERDPWTLTLDEEPVDPHLIQLLIMDRLSAGDARPQFTVIDDGRYQTWQFSEAGREQLRVADGQYDTLILRYADSDSKAGMTLWCAPALDYLPVRIEHLDHKGKSTVAELSAIEWQQAAED